MTKRYPAFVLSVAAALVLVVGVPSAALAATVAETPVTGSWGPYKACSNQPGANCAAVYAMTEINGTVYIGGDFTSLKDPNSGATKTIKSLAALDSNGQPVAGFTGHTFNGAIRALATDGNTVFVGGGFTKVDGASQAHLAAFTASGGRVSYPSVNQTVRALLVSGGWLYTGATTVKKLSPSTGAAAAGFVPPAFTSTNTAAPYVWSLAAGGSRLYVGGHFDAPRRSIVALDTATGSVDASFAPTLSVSDPNDPLQGIDDMAVTGDSVFAAQAGHSNRAYRYTLAGVKNWMVSPDGDVQTVELDGTSVYLGGHFTCWTKCSTTPVLRDHIAAVSYNNGTLDSTWAPEMGASYTPYYYGVWVLRKVGTQQLWAGGVFNSVTINGANLPARKVAIFQ